MHEQPPDHPPAEGDTGPDGHDEQAETTPAIRPHIWVGSWADYNNGILHGEWIDAARDPEDLQADIDAMLAASPVAARDGIPSEDWGVFDFDEFGPLRLGEQPSLERVALVARGIVENGRVYAAFAALQEDEGVPEADFASSYMGHYESVEAYVEEMVDGFGYEAILDQAVPANFRAYVKLDVVALARDLQLGDIHVVPADDGGVWLFDIE